MIDTATIYTLAQQQGQREDSRHLADLAATLRLDRGAAWNAQAYLDARKIPLAVAHDAGVTYVAAGASQQYGEWIRSWEERLLFPLLTPTGEVGGFTGRLVRGWQHCRDAAAHQARLRASGDEPWIKTTGTGWFWMPEHLPASEPVVVVEGPFDRLAVLATGNFEPGEVIALAGMPFQPAWLSTTQAVLFALNRSQASKEARQRLKQALAWKQVRVETCPLPADRHGWSERWRREGMDALEALYAHHALLAHDL